MILGPGIFPEAGRAGREVWADERGREGMGGRREGRTGMHSLPRRVSGTSPAFKSPRGTPPMLPSLHPQGKRTGMEDALPVGGLDQLVLWK